MLAELRQALADTLQEGMPTARVLPAPPASLDWPESNLLVWVQPADNWIEQAWVTFSTSGRATVNFDVVVTVPPWDGTDTEPTYAALDDAVDPLSTGETVFAAINANADLGITDFQVDTVAMLESVTAPQVVAIGESNAVRFVAVVPVKLTVQRS